MFIFFLIASCYLYVAITAPLVFSQIKCTAMSAKKLPQAKGRVGSSRRPRTLCGIFQSLIVDGKEEALLCEGGCGQWFHRGCASVPPDCYKELASSEEPFICLYCSNVQLKRSVDELTATVLSLKEDLKEALTFREHLSSITSEVSALKQSLNSLTTQPSSLTATHRRKPQTYAAVVRPPSTSKK